MSGAVIHVMAAGVLMVAAVPDLYGTKEAVAAAWWSLLPIVGALGASLMAFLLNRISENRRAVIGRVIGAMAAGVGFPRLLTYTHPWVQTMTLDPIILILSGFVSGLFGYAAAVVLVDKVFKMAPSVVDKQMERLAASVAAKVSDQVSDRAALVAVQLSDRAEVKAEDLLDKAAVVAVELAAKKSSGQG